MDGNQFLNDPVLDFCADVNDIQLMHIKALKGLTGGYQSTAVLSRLGDSLQINVQESFRHLNRLLIPTTREQRQQLIQAVIDRVQHPELNGHYFFLTNNCAQDLRDLLFAAGLDIAHLPSSPLPQRNFDFIRLSGLSPYPVKTSLSLFSLMKEKMPDFTSEFLSHASEIEIYEKLIMHDTLTLQRLYYMLSAVPGASGSQDMLRLYFAQPQRS